MGVADQSQDQSADVRDWVSETLRQGDLAEQGWSAEAVTWRERDLAVVRVSHPEMGTFAVEIFDEPSSRGAFARGTLYGAATRRGPGLVDVGSESTHQAARSAAYGLCSALAERTSGPTITQAPSPSLAVPQPGLSGQALATVIQEALSRGTVAGLERWRGPTVSVMTRWGEVAEVEYTRDGTSLVFILSPRDDARSTFVRGHAYELVYYSDDLAPEEHEALYDRDAEAIESFARWFRSWDRSDDAA